MEPVTLSADQVADLNRRLSDLRHEVNNHLSLMLAAMELARYKPETSERMMASLAEQPPKIAQALQQFSGDFEKILGIVRG